MPTIRPDGNKVGNRYGSVPVWWRMQRTLSITSFILDHDLPTPMPEPNDEPIDSIWRHRVGPPFEIASDHPLSPDNQTSSNVPYPSEPYRIPPGRNVFEWKPG